MRSIIGIERKDVVSEVAVNRDCRYSWASRAAESELSCPAETGGFSTAAMIPVKLTGCG